MERSWVIRNLFFILSYLEKKCPTSFILIFVTISQSVFKIFVPVPFYERLFVLNIALNSEFLKVLGFVFSMKVARFVGCAR